MALLRDPRSTVTVVAATAGWADATRTAAQVLPALPAADGHHEPDEEWLELWRDAETAARAAVDELLDDEDAAELRLARDLYAALPLMPCSTWGRRCRCAMCSRLRRRATA